ncbi:MAG: hypothetical protein HY331_05805 [Chloroflexi bacterium]|nr:hypothetical protein [Chloroflexota bacterium]
MNDVIRGQTRGRLTRRELLRGAVAAGLGLGAMVALNGCGPAEAPQAPAATAKPGTTPAAAGGPKRGGTAVIALTGSDITTFNQAAAFGGGSWFLSTSIFGRVTVMDYGPPFEIHPQLAREWESTPDAKIYTFKLAKNVKWHDGKPLTAADVKFTWLGVVEQKGPAATFLKDIETIETPDDHTLKVILKKPDASFLYQTSVYPRLPVLPKHLYEGTEWKSNPYNMKPVGSGPFKFQELVPGDHCTLVANEEYFEGRPYLDRVIWKLVPDERTALAGLESGEFAALDSPPSLNMIADLRKKPGIEVDAPPGPWGAYIGFNMKKKPLDNVDVRWAIAHAINKEDVTKRVTGGVAPVSEGAYTKGIRWAWNPEVKAPEYSTAKAEELLDKAGLKRGGDGVRFKLGLSFSSGGFYDLFAEVLKEQLSKVGIAVDLKPVDGATFQSQMPKLEHDLTIYALWIGPDPNEWKQQLEKDGFRNWFGYVNPEVEDLFTKGVQVADREKRKQHYFKIQEIVMRDMPRYNIFDAPYSFAHRTEYKGWFSDEGTISYRMDLAKVYKAQ